MEETRADKLRNAGVKRFGSEEAWRAHLRLSAAKASHTKPQGFAVLRNSDPERLKQISSLGGRKSKREAKKETGDRSPQEES